MLSWTYRCAHICTVYYSKVVGIIDICSFPQSSAHIRSPLLLPFFLYANKVCQLLSVDKRRLLKVSIYVFLLSSLWYIQMNRILNVKPVKIDSSSKPALYSNPKVNLDSDFTIKRCLNRWFD